jgi:hypothetical protein
MGTDIHMVVEKQTENFGWVTVNTLTGHHSAWSSYKNALGGS